LTTDRGMIKLVDRQKFSYANFTQGRFQWMMKNSPVWTLMN
jgi:hypothetical protein